VKQIIDELKRLMKEGNKRNRLMKERNKVLPMFVTITMEFVN